MPPLELSFPILIFVIFLLGVITGGFSNVTSGGAGIFTVYFLTNYVGLVIQESTGTVLAASTLIVLIGAISFYRKKQVDTKLAMTVGLMGVAGAFIAARWAATLKSVTLEHAFGAFTLALAGYTTYRFITAWQRRRSSMASAEPSTVGVTPGAVSAALPTPAELKSTTGSLHTLRDEGWWIRATVAGALLGFATGLFGVGLAGLTVVLFMLLFKLDMEMVLGTSLFASFFRYLGGSIGYLSNGQVEPIYFAVLLTGGGLGSIIGARIVLGGGKGSKDMYIKMIVILMLLFISYEFLLKAYFPIHLHL